MLVKLGLLFNGVVGVVLAVPIVRYLLSPVIREQKTGYESWLSLGGLEQFPGGRDAARDLSKSSRQCLRTAKPRIFPAGCDTWMVRSSRCSPSIARIWDARFAGSRSRACSCVRATAALTIRTDRAPPGLPSAACSSTATKLSREIFSLRRARCPLPGPPAANTNLDGEAAMRLIQKLGAWFEARLQLGSADSRDGCSTRFRVKPQAGFMFSAAPRSRCFMLQIVTGILLALIYVPSAGEAWNSLQILNHRVTLGWFIRALHGWGSNFMVAIVLIHMVQVFLFGAYKFPRELTWMVGVLLLLVTLGMAFTGQVLRFDQDAYWGLGIGASIASRVPVIGPWAVNLMLGGPIIAGATLSRFFALHVFVIPGLLIAFVGLHLLLVLKLGINEWPMPGRIVRRATYMQEYHELTHKHGVPFVPGAVWKDMFFSGFILLAIAVCAVHFGPFGPSGQPDPTIIQTAPRPDYFFLWLYAVLSLLPPSLETPMLLIGPVIGIGRAAGASVRSR